MDITESNKLQTVMSTPPPCFGPKVSPNGLSTSTSIFFAAAAFLAVISRPLLPPLLVAFLLLSAPKNVFETPLFASCNDSPWKLVLWRSKIICIRWKWKQTKRTHHWKSKNNLTCLSHEKESNLRGFKTVNDKTPCSYCLLIHILNSKSWPSGWGEGVLRHNITQTPVGYYIWLSKI